MTRIRALTELEAGEIAVAVRRVETPKGERLEFAVPDRDESVRLDAVLLEWVTHQGESTFRGLLEAHGRDDADEPAVAASPEARITAREELTSVTNEFAHVEVDRVTTPNGERLALVAPKLDVSVYLNGRALEAMTYPSMGEFSELLREYIE